MTADQMQPIYKYIRMIKRRPGLTLPEFGEQWIAARAERDKQATQGTAVRRIVKNVSTGEIDAGAPLQEMIAQEYQMGEKGDAAAVLRGSRRLKIIRTVFRRNDLSPQQFKDYWLHNHSKLEDIVIRQSPVIRIVATFAVPAALDGKAAPFDGMVELYFKSGEEIRSMFASAIPAMMRKDEENFVQMDAPAIRFVADEFITKERAD